MMGLSIIFDRLVHWQTDDSFLVVDG